MNENDLHCWTNGTDTVSARDAEDAAKVIAEHTGEDVADCGVFELVPDGKLIAVWDEDAEESTKCVCREWARTDVMRQTPNGHHPHCRFGCPRMTARAWAARGRGFVCSTEW